jgi:transcription-repair coupling factor (superfamily II helicase)
MIDRYGAPPEAARSLFALRTLRLVAELAGAEQVRLGRGELRVKLSASRPVGRDVVGALVGASDTRLEFLTGDGRSFRARSSGGTPADWILRAQRLLKAIARSDTIAV